MAPATKNNSTAALLQLLPAAPKKNVSKLLMMILPQELFYLTILKKTGVVFPGQLNQVRISMHFGTQKIPGTNLQQIINS